MPTSYKGQPNAVSYHSRGSLLYLDECGPQSGSRTLRCGTGIWPSSACLRDSKENNHETTTREKHFPSNSVAKAGASRRLQHIGTLLLGRYPGPIHSRTSGFHCFWIFSLLGPVGTCEFWEFCGSRGVLGEDHRKQSLSHLPAFCTRPKGACVLPWLF